MKKNWVFTASSISLILFQACNPLGDLPTTEINYHPGTSLGTTTTPISSISTFTPLNSSQYNFDSTKIDFLTGAAELTPSSQNDLMAGVLTGVTNKGTTVDPTRSVLRIDESGGLSDLELSANWTPAWSNIVGYWKLNETSGTSFADSGPLGVNTGTLHAPVTIGTAGLFGSAANFNGSGFLNSSGGYIDAGDAPSLHITSAVTIGGWMNTTNASGFQVIAARMLATTDYELENNTGQFRFVVTVNGTTQSIIGNIPAVANTWQYIVGTYDGNDLKIYVNGVSAGSHNAPGVMSNYDTNLLIGRRGDNFGSVQGLLDEVAIWNTALSASSIATIYQHQSGKHAGTFTSRVMDGFSITAPWTNFSWISTLPFFKSLPDAGNSELTTDYPSQSSNLMSGLQGLWHFNEASNAVTVTDSSGSTPAKTGIPTNVTFAQSGPLYQSAAFFNSSVVVASPASVPTGGAPRTMSAWIYSDNPSAENTDFFYYGTGDCTGNMFGLGNSNGALKFWGGCKDFNSTLLIVPHHWNFVSVTYDGNNIVLTLNGVSQTVAVGALTTQASGIFFGAESINNGAFFRSYSTIRIAEAAIWNRALSSTEVLELYRRGTNRVKFQVRTCSASDCSDDSSQANWKGPDNSSQSYFSELNNTTLNAAGAAVQTNAPTITFANFTSPTLSITNQRYFQYRAIMESDDAGLNCDYGGGANSTWCSPEIKSISVGPGHYDTTAPTISNKTGFNYTTLATLVETLGASGCSQGTGYNLSPDNIHWYYWTGAAWGLADGTVSKTNSAATLTTHLPSFATQAGNGNLYFKAFLQSSGTSACAIDQLQVTGTQ